MCEGAEHGVDCLLYPVAAHSVDGLPRIEGGDWVEHRVGLAK